MSDREQLEAMLTKTGIVFSVEVLGAEKALKDETVYLEVEAQRGDQNLGYMGFVSQLGFDDNGNLLWWGMWE